MFGKAKLKLSKKPRSRFSQIVFAHLRRVRKDIFFASFCILGSTLTTLIIPWPMKLIFDNVLSDKPLPALLMPFQDVFANGNAQTLLILCGSMIGIA
ncbi:MAG: hypothetical protein HOP36_07760, partial [Methyloglobulus sp.]|nr:hypothetical protein [Methyloglobulus sp.]